MGVDKKHPQLTFSRRRGDEERTLAKGGTWTRQSAASPRLPE